MQFNLIVFSFFIHSFFNTKIYDSNNSISPVFRSSLGKGLHKCLKLHFLTLDLK